MLLIVLIVIVSSAFAGTRTSMDSGEVPQGGNGYFYPDGQEDCQTDPHWEIIGPDNRPVGCLAKTNGWAVQFDGNTFGVFAPPNAVAQSGYRVRFRNSNSLASGASSGTFTVTPAGVGTGTTATGGTTTTGTTTGGGTPTLTANSILETRSHAVTVNYEVFGGAPVTAGTTTTTYYICSDNALSDAITPVAGGTAVGPLTLSDPNNPPTYPSFTMSGWAVDTNAFQFHISPPTSSGGAERIFLIKHVVTSGGITNTMLQRNDYNLTQHNMDSVPIDSRKIYGQPDIAGEVKEDGNAPLRNANYYGWTYNGGLFAGNSPTTTPDRSGTARSQFYRSDTTTFTGVTLTDLVLCYLGSPTGFSSDSHYRIYSVSNTDPSYFVTAATVTWSTAWNIGTAIPGDPLDLSTLSYGDYANFQGTTVPNRITLALANEATDVSASTPDWRYFASPEYAVASGLITAMDAQPHVWVLDCTFAD